MKTKQRGVLLSVIAFAIALVFVGSGLLISLPSASASEPVATEQVGLVKLTDDYQAITPKMQAHVGGETQNATGGKISNTTYSLVEIDADGNLVTENASAIDAQRALDPAVDNGLLVTSAKSGKDAEGTSVMLGTFSGKFDIDFRVFSKNTYEGSVVHKGSTSSAGNYLTGEMANPYNDLQKLTLRFTEKKENGRSFDVILDGATPSWGNTSTSYIQMVTASVKTDNMTAPTAIATNTFWNAAGGQDYNNTGLAPHGNTTFYLDKWNAVVNDDTEGDAVITVDEVKAGTPLYGSTFSNGFSYAKAYQAPTWIHFDPAVASEADSTATAPVVYSMLSGNGTVRYVRAISILNNEKLTGSAGLSTGDFSDEYTVEAIFSEITANDTPVTVNQKVERYDRYANMLIYGINGVKPTAKTLGATFAVTEEIKDSYAEGNITIPSAKLNLDTTAPVTVTLSKNGGEAQDITSALTQALTYGKYTVKYSATVSDKTYTYEVPFTVVRSNSIVSNLNGVNVSTGELGPVKFDANGYSGLNMDAFHDYFGDDDALIVTSNKSGTEASGSSFRLGSTMQGKFDLDFQVFSKNSFEGTNRAWGTEEGQYGRYNHDTNPYNDLQKLTFKFTDIDSGRWFNVELFGSEVYVSNAITIGVKTDKMPIALSLNEGGGLVPKGHYNTNVRSWSFSNKAAKGNTMPNIHFDPETMEVYIEDVQLEKAIHEKKLLLDLNDPTHTLDGELKSYLNGSGTWIGNEVYTTAGSGGDNIIPSFGRYTVDVIFEEVTANDREISQLLLSPVAPAIANSTTYEGTYSTITVTDRGVYSGPTKAGYFSSTYDRYAKLALYSLNGQKLGAEAEAMKDATAPIITIEGGDKIERRIEAVGNAPSATAYDMLVPGITVTNNWDEVFADKDNLTVGDYQVTYTATDGDNTSTKILTVTVKDLIPPSLTINESERTIKQSELASAILPTFVVTDNIDDEVTVLSDWTDLINADTKAGEYTVTFTAIDSSNNEFSQTVEVIVIDDIKPVITLNGESSIEIDLGDTDPLAEVVDNNDDVVTLYSNWDIQMAEVKPGDTVTVTYTATDLAGNEAVTVTRTVKIIDDLAPVISLGDIVITDGVARLEVDLKSEDLIAPIASATDNSEKVMTVTDDWADSVDETNVGSYTVTYTCTDNDNNTATVVLTVVIGDTTAPEVTAGDDIVYEKGATNKSVSVSVTAINGYTFTYQWYKDGEILSGATSASYNLPALSEGEYTYYCEVTAVRSIDNAVTATVKSEDIMVLVLPVTAPQTTGGCGASEVATVLGLLGSLLAVAFIVKKK